MRCIGSFNPSFLLDGLGIRYIGEEYLVVVSVSILVSYWMGWEFSLPAPRVAIDESFNPSFLLDGLGILRTYPLRELPISFNPSFLLDGLGIGYALTTNRL